MSKATELLESAVADVIASRPADGARPSARQRAAADRAFATVMKIVAPRIRHFIRQYGLAHHWEDAEQVCAIGVHRAIEAYDPARAMFTTFVNWQLRGELQGLRFRLMADQRPSAKKVEAVTISLHGVEHGPDGEDVPLEALIEDEAAVGLTEAGAGDHMAGQVSQALLDEYVRHLRGAGLAQLQRKAREARGAARSGKRSGSPAGPAPARGGRIDPDDVRRLEERISRDRAIVGHHLFGRDGDGSGPVEQGLTRERIRQITRRAAKLIGELASADPRFAAMTGNDADTGSATDKLLPRGNHRTAGPGEIRVSEPEPPLPPGRREIPIRLSGPDPASRH